MTSDVLPTKILSDWNTNLVKELACQTQKQELPSHRDRQRFKLSSPQRGASHCSWGHQQHQRVAMQTWSAKLSD